jgi:hypothetical protein
MHSYFPDSWHMFWPIHQLHSSFINLIIFGEEYTLWSSSLCSLLELPNTSSFFGPNILLSTLFSNTLSLCSSLNVKDQALLPCTTQATLQSCYIQVFFCRETSARSLPSLQEGTALASLSSTVTAQTSNNSASLLYCTSKMLLAGNWYRIFW